MKRVWLGILLIGIALDARAVAALQIFKYRPRYGHVLPTYRCRGEYWVAGTPGRVTRSRFRITRAALARRHRG